MAISVCGDCNSYSEEIILNLLEGGAGWSGKVAKGDPMSDAAIVAAA